MEDKPLKGRIFVYSSTTKYNEGCSGVALSEDGYILAGHGSSNLSFLKRDLGVEGTSQHDVYAEHYPYGFDVEFTTGNSEAFKRAARLNRSRCLDWKDPDARPTEEEIRIQELETALRKLIMDGIGKTPPEYLVAAKEVLEK